MDISSIVKDSATLPDEFEPLLLTFHQPRMLPDGFVLLGSDGGTNLAVDPTSRFVLSIDSRQGLPARFVNSSVRQLGRCIDAYRVYVVEVTATREQNEQLPVVERLARAIRQIDEPSVSAPQNWWSIILQQANDGNL